jgi:ribonucleoside-diphosphate reductase alpha chain
MTPRAAERPAAGPGLRVSRRFTSNATDPFDTVTWERRTAVITDANGGVVFEQRDVEVPAGWSQLATNVVASKYFHGHPGTPERETSVRQLINRVVRALHDWAEATRMFASTEDLTAFADELTYVLVHQMAAFNSPVWFNVGIYDRPQGSACFINSVEDSLTSILDLAKTEAKLFKFGSGTGTNLSVLRGSNEPLSGGGTASGPVSFMRGYDAFAGVIKSGGKTRRAAKMVLLDVDHPDILDFINAKAGEEKKAWALIDAGYDGSIDGEAYSSVFFQNSNNSVRVSDAFMQAVEYGGTWETIRRTDGKVAKTYDAPTLMRAMAEAAHLCGDPGVQFDTTINAWHTCKATDRIYASNPCSEFLFLNDTACNLSSLNVLKFRRNDGSIDVDNLTHVVDLMFTAQELLVDACEYPTAAITERSRNFRPLGLGYANLGALLMANGVPYDSDDGRALAGALTAIICGEAYAQSARIAARRGAFGGFVENSTSMRDVIDKHRQAVDTIDASRVSAELMTAAQQVWDSAIALGARHGYRNAQATVIAPTGTIGFMMDCDTTGVEPDIALVKYKKLVGGGVAKIVNGTVGLALSTLGYDAAKASAIMQYVEERGTIEGAPGLEERHLAIFDCAFEAEHGTRSITPMGHLRMMAAVQPFVSGAISKTVNLPSDASVDDVADAYMSAWRMGLKAIAIYRDGSKRVQPLSTRAHSPLASLTAGPNRERLPDERRAITHKFSIAGHEGYVTVGLYDDGRPGEVFITMSKEGSTISGLMDALATTVSIALQYGVPLSVIADKLSHTRYEPSGFTGNKDIPIAKSITDYIFRWLASKFSHSELAAHVQPRLLQQTPSKTEALEHAVAATQGDAPACAECGSITVRAGTCYRCMNCGATTGCS